MTRALFPESHQGVSSRESLSAILHRVALNDAKVKSFADLKGKTLVTQPLCSRRRAKSMNRIG